MPLYTPNNKDVILAKGRSNAGIMACYYKKLHKLLNTMHKEFMKAIKIHYSNAQSDIVHDASPIALLKQLLATFAGKWMKRWTLKADDIASYFVKSNNAETTRHLQKRMEDAGFAIKFNPSRKLQQIMGLSVAENVQLIKSIPQKYLDDVQGLVLRSAIKGGDLGSLTKELTEKYGISKRRAAFIARDQNDKVTSVINRTRAIQAGITQGIWCHNGNPKTPRPDHVKASQDKLKYDLKKGAYISGEYIQPGELPNCGCSFRPVIPGLETLTKEKAVHDTQLVMDENKNHDEKGRFTFGSNGSTANAKHEEKPDEKKEKEKASQEKYLGYAKDLIENNKVPDEAKWKSNKIHEMPSSTNPQKEAIRFGAATHYNLLKNGYIYTGSEIRKQPKGGSFRIKNYKHKTSNATISLRNGKIASYRTGDDCYTFEFNLKCNDNNIKTKNFYKFKFPKKK